MYVFGDNRQIKVNQKNEKVLKYKFLKRWISIKKPKRILDFGTGTGVYARSIYYESFDIKKIIGFDQKTEISKAKEHGQPSGIKFLSEWKTVKIKKYDFVFCIDVLEHLNSPSEALKNIHNVMTENGILFVHVPLEMQGIYQLKFFRTCKDKNSYHVNHWKNKDIKEILKSNGFVEITSYHHYHIISGIRDWLKYFLIDNFDGERLDWNCYWFKNLPKSLQLLSTILDYLSYWETRLLSWCPIVSSGISIVLKKVKEK